MVFCCGKWSKAPRKLIRTVGRSTFLPNRSTTQAPAPEAHYYAHFQAGHLQAIVHSPTAISPLVAQQAVDTELQRVLLHKALCQATDWLGTTAVKPKKNFN